MNDNLDNYFYDPEDDDIDLLTDEEKERIKYQSMHNTYKLIVNEYNFEVFPDKLFWLLTDFDSLSVFDVLIEYFAHEDREEYEKCAILKKIKEERMKNRPKRATKKGKFTYNLGFDPDDLPFGPEIK